MGERVTWWAMPILTIEDFSIRTDVPADGGTSDNIRLAPDQADDRAVQADRVSAVEQVPTRVVDGHREPGDLSSCGMSGLVRGRRESCAGDQRRRTGLEGVGSMRMKVGRFGGGKRHTAAREARPCAVVRRSGR